MTSMHDCLQTLSLPYPCCGSMKLPRMHSIVITFMNACTVGDDCVCACMHAAYIDDNGSKDCVAFTVYINATGSATCDLKPKAIATGEKCPDGTTCISGTV